MNAIGRWLAVAMVLTAAAPAARGQALPLERGRQQQRVQQQVRVMAQQLVGAVLDRQLQQLRENGLAKHPWYGEIRAMRKHLGEMVEAEMPEVIQLLAGMEKAGDAERAKIFTAARQRSREIVVRLLVERQSLLRRLKIMEMVAQVEQLIVLQTKVQDATDALPEQPLARRAAANLTTLEDQQAILDLLGVERIGVNLTEEFMLHPEQSTSAIVLHHPKARYFTVG